MDLEIRGHGVDVNEPLRDYVASRLRFALGRFDPRLGRVRVRLRDLNGPRGGVDKVCQVESSLHGAGDLVVAGRGADLYAAISRAADRARHALVQKLGRRFKAQGTPLRRRRGRRTRTG